jgi:hypothetical protein
MRIAKLHMDPQDKQRFEIHGKSSVKYHLKANHVVEAKRWYWTLNNAIQHAKDEAKGDERKKKEELEAIGRLKEQAFQGDGMDCEKPASTDLKRQSSITVSEPAGRVACKRSSVLTAPSAQGNYSETSLVGARPYSARTDVDLGDNEPENGNDDASSAGPEEPPSSDSLSLVANAARLQLDLLSQVSLALQFEHENNPGLQLSDSNVVAAMLSYESAVGSLKQLIGDLLNMSKERDTYWRYRMEKEVALRQIWEENMAKLAEEQEALEGKVVGERERRKKTKRALKQALQRDTDGIISVDGLRNTNEVVEEGFEGLDQRLQQLELDQEGSAKRKQDIDEFSESDSDESDQFFDAIDAGEVEVVKEMPTSIKSPMASEFDGGDSEYFNESVSLEQNMRENRLVAIKSSFLGYEDPPRERLAMDTDDRPKVSLWVRKWLLMMCRPKRLTRVRAF